MAKKCEWEGKPAYEEGPLIMMLEEDINRWRVYHKRTKWLMIGPDIGSFKQKREALAFANGLIARFNMNFDSKEQMQELNGGKENCMRLRKLAYDEAMAIK